MSTTVTTEEAPDLRHGIRSITFFAATLFTIRVWSGYDPRPEDWVAAIEAASLEKMEAYVVIACAAVVGVLALLRYIIAAAVNGLASQTNGLVSWACVLALGSLAAGILTPYTTEFTAVAVLCAAGANWLVELARDRIGKTAG